jgi:hypothetical protein
MANYPNKTYSSFPINHAAMRFSFLYPAMRKAIRFSVNQRWTLQNC